MKLTMQDIIAAGFCARGAKTWFQLHKLDFRKFLKEGIDSSELPDDAMGRRVVEAAKVRHGR